MPGLGMHDAGIKKGHFVLGYSYSTETASKYFSGSHPNRFINSVVSPKRRGNVLNIIGMYQFNSKASLAVTMPLVFNSYAFYPRYVTPQDFAAHSAELSTLPRYKQRANGLGDLSIVYRSLLFKPNKERSWNTSYGLGLVLPTGNFNAQSVYPDYEGNDLEKRSVFKTIMPGAGGVGIYGEAQVFKTADFPVKGTTYWGFGSYLAQPRGRNSTESTLGNLWGPDKSAGIQHALKNSVADQYLVRCGAFIPIPRTQDRRLLRGARIFLGGRFSGTPRQDFIGPSNGYRQPGEVIAAEPGLTYTLGRYGLTMTTPIYFLQRSQNDLAQENIGEAAFQRNLATIPRWQFNIQLARRY